MSTVDLLTWIGKYIGSFKILAVSRKNVHIHIKTTVMIFRSAIYYKFLIKLPLFLNMCQPCECYGYIRWLKSKTIIYYDCVWKIERETEPLLAVCFWRRPFFICSFKNASTIMFTWRFVPYISIFLYINIPESAYKCNIIYESVVTENYCLSLIIKNIRC